MELNLLVLCGALFVFVRACEHLYTLRIEHEATLELCFPFSLSTPAQLFKMVWRYL